MNSLSKHEVNSFECDKSTVFFCYQFFSEQNTRKRKDTLITLICWINQTCRRAR